jgi:large subunit ribosomal protein L24
MKLRKGDEVIITAGKDKGKKGKIEKVLPKKSAVIIPGLNLFKRHLKKQNENNPGGIVEFPRAIPFGNVALIDPKSGKPTRVGYVIKGSEKMRVAKASNTVISK